jgi:hypothetical protein
MERKSIYWGVGEEDDYIPPSQPEYIPPKRYEFKSTKSPQNRKSKIIGGVGVFPPQTLHRLMRLPKHSTLRVSSSRWNLTFLF